MTLRLIHDPRGGQYIAQLVGESGDKAIVRRWLPHPPGYPDGQFEIGTRRVLKSWILGDVPEGDKRAEGARKKIGEAK